VKRVEEMIEDLPPDLQQEVDEFVEFLSAKHLRKPQSKPKFDWAGALKDLREQYSSVELQHKISDCKF
jgi:hypothetical protein